MELNLIEKDAKNQVQIAQTHALFAPRSVLYKMKKLEEGENISERAHDGTRSWKLTAAFYCR
jgi:hypothetical protein